MDEIRKDKNLKKIYELSKRLIFEGKTSEDATNELKAAISKCSLKDFSHTKIMDALGELFFEDTDKTKMISEIRKRKQELME